MKLHDDNMEATDGLSNLETSKHNEQQKRPEAVKRKRRRSRNKNLREQKAELESLESKGTLPVDVPRETKPQGEERVESKKPMIKNLTFHWNSARYDNPIGLLCDNAQRSKKSIQFQDLGRTACGSFSCAVSIDHTLIATGMGSSKKLAKRKCADTAVKLLQISQPVVDRAKSSKAKEPLPGRKEELPVLQRTEFELSKIPKSNLGDQAVRKVQLTITGSGTNCVGSGKKKNSEISLSKSIKHNSVKKFIRQEIQLSNNSVIKEHNSVERLCKQGELQDSSSSLSRSKEYPKIPESNVGCQMLRKMGWTGGGLGPEGNKGRVDPVMASVVRRRQGLGIDVSTGSKKKEPTKCSNISIVKEFMKNTEQKELHISNNLMANELTSIESFCKQRGLKYNLCQSKNACLVITKPTASPMTGKSVELYVPADLVKRVPVVAVSRSVIHASVKALPKKTMDVDTPAVAMTTKVITAAQKTTTGATDLNTLSAPSTIKASSDDDTPTVFKATTTTIDIVTPAAPKTTTFPIDTPSVQSSTKANIDVNTPTAPNTATRTIYVDTPNALSTTKESIDVDMQAPSMTTKATFQVDLPTEPTTTKASIDVDTPAPTTAKAITDVNMPAAPVPSKLVIDLDKLFVPDPCKPVIDVDEETENRAKNSVDDADIIGDSGLKTFFKRFLTGSEKELRMSNRLSRRDRYRLFKLCDQLGLHFQLVSKGEERWAVIGKSIH